MVNAVGKTKHSLLLWCSMTHVSQLGFIPWSNQRYQKTTQSSILPKQVSTPNSHHKTCIPHAQQHTRFPTQLPTQSSALHSRLEHTWHKMTQHFQIISMSKLHPRDECVSDLSSKLKSNEIHATRFSVSQFLVNRFLNRFLSNIHHTPNSAIKRSHFDVACALAPASKDSASMSHWKIPPRCRIKRIRTRPSCFMCTCTRENQSQPHRHHRGLLLFFLGCRRRGPGKCFEKGFSVGQCRTV